MTGKQWKIGTTTFRIFFGGWKMGTTDFWIFFCWGGGDVLARWAERSGENARYAGNRLPAVGDPPGCAVSEALLSHHFRLRPHDNAV